MYDLLSNLFHRNNEEEYLYQNMKRNSFNISDFYDTIVCDILSRLPVKSLLRFKVVCKTWLFLIEQDSYFIHLHLSRSKSCLGDKGNNNISVGSLLISIPMLNQFNFILTDMYQVDQVVKHKLSCFGNYLRYTYFLKPIDGLICFLYHPRSNHEYRFHIGYVCISNIITGKQTPWIELSNLEKRKRAHMKITRRHVGFGVDPDTKQYKLICICELSERTPDPLAEEIELEEFCEVLDFGSNDYTWRRIDDVPMYRVCGEPLYVNGSIYWRTWRNVYSTHWKNKMNMPSLLSDDLHEGIVAFDIKSEKFRVIKIPDYIVFHPQVHQDFFESYPDAIIHRNFYDLLEVDGRIAFVDIWSNSTVKLWIIDDTSTNWIEETISMPFADDVEDADHPHCYSFETIPGTDQIIFTDPEEQMNWSLSSIYYYDRTKKTIKKVDITGLGAKSLSIPKRCCKITTFVESLIPAGRAN